MPFIAEEAHGKPVLMGLLADVGPVDQAEGCWRISSARQAVRRFLLLSDSDDERRGEHGWAMAT
jgi:hypothetical protein